jgi:hypothetical protein
LHKDIGYSIRNDMKKLFYSLFLLVAFTTVGLAQSQCVDVEEIDGSPKAPCIKQLKVTNGTLSCPTVNRCTLTISGGGGGSPGGADTNVQYNDSGSFGGVAGFIFDKTSKISLGVAGTSVGAVGFRNATSGTITVQPVTGALGTVTLSLPATTGTLALVSQLTAGTVTSVGFTGGLISVATATTTPAFTVAGTSGGIPYFSSGSTWATSAALTANLPVIGGGAGVAPSVGTRSGNTTGFATFTGTATSGKCLEWDANGNVVTAVSNAACGAGGSGITIGTTTVTSGTDTRILYNNAGVVGQYTLTGTGTTVAMSAGPTFTGTLAAADVTASGTITQTSASATAFQSGPNGGTNPVFQLVNSTASQADGLSITGLAAGNGVTLTALSSGSNAPITLTPKGSGIIALSSATRGIRGGNGIPSYSFGTSTTDGIGHDTGSSMLLVSSGANLAVFTGGASGVFQLGSGGRLTWASTADPNGAAADATFRRLAAASIVQGAANSATPVANLFTIGESSRGGTDSNVAGANGTIQAGLGTGTGGGGSLIFRTGTPGSTGTTANSYATALTINNAGHLIVTGTAPTIASGFGTSPSIAGADHAGRVTVGTGGVATTGAITFGQAFATAPACTVNNETTVLLAQATATTTTLTITSATPFTASDKLTYVCLGY